METEGGKAMPKQMKLLRIYTDESAYFGDRRVYEEIAARARRSGLAGATVVQALFGFGRSPNAHRRHVLEDEQSLVIEIVDEEIRLRVFASGIGDVDGIGLMTLEAVEVLDRAIPDNGGAQNGA
jgi:PII-like signaling protein